MRECFKTDVSHDFTQAGLLAFSDRCYGTRSNLKATWDLMEEWENREPTTHRQPAPPEAVQAVLAVALAWRWWRFAVITWVVFDGLLRPGEGNDVRVKDIHFVGTGNYSKGYGTGVFVIVIREPKTQRKYARAQNVI